MNSISDFDPQKYAADFERDGYFICEAVLPFSQLNALAQAIENVPSGEEVRKKQNVYGIRNLLEVCPEVCSLANQPAVRQFATAVLGSNAFAVRAIFFDKVPGSNWSLFWHQDNVIAVQEKREVPGYIAWSHKAGIWQVQPPAEVLARMVAVRVHLDECGEENGPLRVLPGSHRFGWLDEELDAWKARVPEVVCAVGRGGIVSMCPLTLHASARSVAAQHRRVIHIEYAATDLPGGLEWKHRVRPELS
ncbi:Phytanoyl-CoA dioxygenase (PhyH) [Anatilimnocola aggregata]|uniref:Phytanoyl-CoA dioxygenase (PhyH) n=1 Tax=Anatilimnocola aggregata TaxID=2528021 RepID=A0A517YEI2_9BACT|nr:phytanoyl-CoA dioxygenase family protein [Anatilimnocola aggregata]QDU28627.1 Phytanoyl-CoA dioxygenase (PhyH) [Anatilimnocola aggregata]